jgi:hypothetical protein
MTYRATHERTHAGARTRYGRSGDATSCLEARTAGWSELPHRLRDWHAVSRSQWLVAFLPGTTRLVLHTLRSTRVRR